MKWQFYPSAKSAEFLQYYLMYVLCCFNHFRCILQMQAFKMESYWHKRIMHNVNLGIVNNFILSIKLRNKFSPIEEHMYSQGKRWIELVGFWRSLLSSDVCSWKATYGVIIEIMSPTIISLKTLKTRQLIEKYCTTLVPMPPLERLLMGQSWG